MPLTRRHFLGSLAAAAVSCERHETPIPGSIVGGSAALGHRLRGGSNFSPSARTEKAAVVIIGAGIAGLAAARQLSRAGMKEVILLELETEPGGTSLSGRNEVSAYPWAAHYVPIANEESVEIVRLFEELGVITGRDAAGLPIYDETMLCAEPAERLFIHGRWQEGLVPRHGLTAGDREQFARFFAAMDELRAARDATGAPAFAIPIDLSSRAPEWRALDAAPMSQWLDEQGYSSRPLRWFVDYSCRDDYGADARHVSAWAGLHYFASRRRWAANAARETVLTWPEGNGWLAQRLRADFTGRTRTQALVFRIEQDADGVAVDYFDARANETLRLQAPAAICALPRFIAQRLMPGLPKTPGLVYSPWMVANVTLDGLPQSPGADLAWDNVLHESPSLGYVVATHQHLVSHPRATVLTHYWPLDGDLPQAAREKALAKTHADWCAEILADLRRAHPEIRRQVRQVDVYLWGHGMIRPAPAFVWSPARLEMARPWGQVHFAHTDMSGVALFEEAYTRGVAAARAVLG